MVRHSFYYLILKVVISCLELTDLNSKPISSLNNLIESYVGSALKSPKNIIPLSPGII